MLGKHSHHAWVGKVFRKITSVIIHSVNMNFKTMFMIEGKIIFMEGKYFL